MSNLSKDNSKLSPALRLMWLVWDEANKATGHSWSRLNATLKSALSLAIEGGFVFHEEDLSYIGGEMNGHFWMGRGSLYLGEEFYTLACKSGNASAWKAFEHWYNRKPFILDGQRLHVGARIEWRGEHLKVTSFARDHIVACKQRGEQKRPGWTVIKTERIYKITHQDIYDWNKERREAGVL